MLFNNRIQLYIGHYEEYIFIKQKEEVKSSQEYKTIRPYKILEQKLNFNKSYFACSKSNFGKKAIKNNYSKNELQKFLS